MWMLFAGVLALGVGAGFAPVEAGDDDGAVEIRVPLNDQGELDLGELLARLGKWAGVTIDRPASVRLPAIGLAGSLTRAMLGKTLGEGATVSVDGDTLVLRLDGRLREPGRLAEWTAKLRDLASKARAEAARRSRLGFHARASYRPNDPARPTVCLVHGLNSSSGVFANMIPPIEEAGFGVVLYDYPDNQDLDVTAPEFARGWRAFRDREGERRPWALVAHSMGGLVARSYVEGPKYRDDVSDLILIGTPNHGASVARLQASLQLLDGLEVIGRSERLRAVAAMGDGLGESAADMLPGSPFLRELNARPRRKGVHYHILAGRDGFVSAETRRKLESRIKLMTRGTGLLGGIGRLAAADLPAQLDEMSDGTGDGCVAITSTRLKGAPDPVVIPANHVELIRGPLLFPEPGPVACMPYVLKWLAPLKGTTPESK